MILVPAGNASTWTGPTGNNTYLLPGRIPALVDAGVGAPAHLDAIETALGGGRLARVLVTHSHPDHIGGVPALRRRWPGVEVIEPATLRDGDRIAAGDGSLVAMHTPGHAPDHHCFFDETARDLYCGDMLRRGGTVVIPASKGGDLALYLRSLERIRSLGAARLLPGHGPAIDDPDPLIDEYIRHRLDRERQVLAALDAGCTRPEHVVARIYAGLHESLVAAAADSVLAHLIKLESEGRVRREGKRWSLSSEAGQ